MGDEQSDAVGAPHGESGDPWSDAVVSRKRRRRCILRIAVVLLPFAAVGAIELACRLRGFGGHPPVVVHVGHDGARDWYATSRPGAASFFYARRSPTGGVCDWDFATPKPPGTVRIVFLGGSAMQGYPQLRALTNGAFLEAMLGDAWDDGRRAEVLNLGATAMASFPATHFLEEILPHQPDLVVVMSGNNEFYGAYGVSSLHSSGTSPTGMRCMRWVRGLGLTQWLNAKGTIPDPTDEIRRQTLMERVAVKQQVRPDDPLRRAAAGTIRAHLERMVRRCAAHDVPVIVCTVPTNERGLAPIGDDIPAPLPPDDTATFNGHLTAAGELLADRPAESVERLRAALILYDAHAAAHFLLGRALTRLGKHEEALRAYVRARDLDTMPWRAVGAVNDAAIAAAEHGGVLCDMQRAFRDASPGGAIGWELMDDHVHMSLQGQALFARTIARALTELPPPLRVDAEKLERLPDWRTYAQRLGASIYTDYVAASRVNTLFNISFMKQNNPVPHTRFAMLCDELLAEMSELDRTAVDRWRDPGLHVSNHRPLPFVTGYYRMINGDYEAAAEMFMVARSSLRTMSLWRLQLTWYLIKCRRHLSADPTQEDRQLCREAIEIGEMLNRFGGFRDPMGPAYLGMIYNLVGNHQAAVSYLDDTVRYVKGREGRDAVRALADSLVRLGEVDRARLLLTLAQKDAEMAGPAKTMLAELDRRTAAPSASGVGD